MRPTTQAALVCDALNRYGVRYLVIGGIACVLHGYVRATTDVDILIERSPENAAATLGALAELGWGFATQWRPDELLARPITVIGDDPQVDIFTVAWTVKYTDAVGRSSLVAVEGVEIPLIGILDLIETKRTGRPLDQLDIEALERILQIRGE